MSWMIDINNIDSIGIIGNEFVLAEDVYNCDNTLVIPAGAVLTNKVKELLISHGKMHIEVDIHQNKILENSIPKNRNNEFGEFRNLYDKKVVVVKNILNSVVEGKNLDIDPVYKIAIELATFENTYEVLQFLNCLREIDDHSYFHCNNVSILANFFGKWLRFSKEDIKLLTIAGLIHDIGKTTISSEILNKPGKLTDNEYALVKNHTVDGYKLLKNQSIPEEVKTVALAHHEKLDGTGYPLGTTNNEINKFSKVIAICDIYDAMTSKRSYKDKMFPLDALRTIKTEMKDSLCQDYLQVFNKNILKTYLGMWCKLSNGENAKIIFVDDSVPDRPIVKTESGEVFNLQEQTDIEIVGFAD